MLSRFTKLPGLSTFLGNTAYPQEAIDNAVTEIKTLGKKSMSAQSDESLQEITKILVLMKRFSESLHVQRVACHALSNLAMQVVAARWIIQKGGFTLIRKSIARFHSDHKLCWLASSATWNLARPPANRAIIGKDGLTMMLQILYEHKSKEKVANTAVGALSNLSLESELKDIIAEPQHLDVILHVMQQHMKSGSTSVLTSSAGLLANLAVSDEHASVIVRKNALDILIKVLKWNSGESDETLFRNACAALNNLVTAEGFLEGFLRVNGLETIYDFLKTNDNELYVNLLENCLINVDADSNVRTTSYHMAAFHGKLNVLRELYQENMHDYDLNCTDGHKRTLLDYAIAGEHSDCVEFLSRCGANAYSRSSDIPNEMHDALQRGHMTLKKVKAANKKAFVNGLPYFPTDLCNYMTEFTHDVDMLEGMNMY